METYQMCHDDREFNDDDDDRQYRGRGKGYYKHKQKHYDRDYW